MINKWQDLDKINWMELKSMLHHYFKIKKEFFKYQHLDKLSIVYIYLNLFFQDQCSINSIRGTSTRASF